MAGPPRPPREPLPPMPPPSPTGRDTEYSITRGAPRARSSTSQRTESRYQQKLVGWIDHPLGERDDMVKFHQNMEMTGVWTRWVFLQSNQFMLLVPWWPMLVWLPENMHQARLLTDQEFFIRKFSNVLLQCGGFVSPHMMDHERIARRANVSVAQLTQFAVNTDFGARPPEQGERSYPFALKELSRAINEAHSF